MTPQEQASLNRVFGRIVVKTATGTFRPLPGQGQVADALPASPTKPVDTGIKSSSVPIVAPKQETSPKLAEMMKSFPTEAAQVKVTTKAAE